MNESVIPVTSRLSRIARACYGVALLLVLVPLLDLVTRLDPVRLDDAAWRFSAYGSLTQVLVTPLLGLMLGAASSLLVADLRLARTIAALLMALGVVGLLAAGPFVLDAVQVRATTQDDHRPAVSLTALKALLIGILGAVTCAWAGRAIWKTTTEARSRVRPSATERREQLVVGKH